MSGLGVSEDGLICSIILLLAITTLSVSGHPLRSWNRSCNSDLSFHLSNHKSIHFCDSVVRSVVQITLRLHGCSARLCIKHRRISHACTPVAHLGHTAQLWVLAYPGILFARTCPPGRAGDSRSLASPPVLFLLRALEGWFIQGQAQIILDVGTLSSEDSGTPGSPQALVLTQRPATGPLLARLQDDCQPCCQ